MEELRSMLGWISVHWRAQKQQWYHKKNRQESSQDNIYSEATMFPSLTEVTIFEVEFTVAIDLKELGKQQIFCVLLSSIVT